MAYLIKRGDGTVQLVSSGVFSKAVQNHEDAVALIHEAIAAGTAAEAEKMKLLKTLRDFDLPRRE